MCSHPFYIPLRIWDYARYLIQVELLWYTSAALEAIILFRLITLRLIGKAPYSAFAAMQAAMLVRDILLFFIPIRTTQYTVAWEITLPLVLITQSLAGVFCYRSIARLYSRIGQFAVWLFATALIVTALLSFTGLSFELRSLHFAPIRSSFYICYRWVDSLLAGGLVLAVGFLSRFPSPLRRRPANLFRHTALLASYFTTNALSYFLPIASRNELETAQMALICILYAVWSLALSKDGEKTEMWPQLDAETSKWIAERCDRTEDLYHRAAGEILGAQIGRSK